MKQPAECEDMRDVRIAIDALDDQLIGLMALRVRYVERTAVLKPLFGAFAEAPDRVRQVLERVEVGARDKGLPTELALTLWRQLIDWAIAREGKLMAPRNG
jgi:isochorismate pyruvate lyase